MKKITVSMIGRLPALFLFVFVFAINAFAFDKPTIPEELKYQPPVVPNEKNGLPLIEKAIELYQPLNDVDQQILLVDGLVVDKPWFNEEQQAIFDQHVAKNAPAFESLAAAVRLGEVKFEQLFYSFKPVLREMREIAEYRSRRLAMDGEWESALESLILFLQLGEILRRSHHNAVIYMHGLGLQSQTALGLARLAKQPAMPEALIERAIRQIESAMPPDDDLPDLLRAEFHSFVVNAIVEILPDNNNVEEVVRAVINRARPKKKLPVPTDPQAELDKRVELVLSLLKDHPRAFDKDATMHLASQLYLEALRNVSLPTAKWDTSVAEALSHDVQKWPEDASLQTMDMLAISLGHEQPDIPKKAIRKARNKLSKVDNVLGKHLLAEIDPYIPFVVNRHQKCAMIAWQTSMALCLFEERHGELPDSLQQLLDDDILKRLPQDPFGDSLRYSRERKMLWSVGENARDDGGVWEPDSYAMTQILGKMRPAGFPKLPSGPPATAERKDDLVFIIGKQEKCDDSSK